MITGIKSSRIVLPDRITSGYVYLQDSKILSVSSQRQPCDRLLDYGDLYVAPGFIDLHTHGCNGIAYSRCTLPEAQQACAFHMAHGATTLLPTISAGPLEEMETALSVLAQLVDDPDLPLTVPGIHLEGPYLNENQCGAQRPGVITPPNRQAYTQLVGKLGQSIARWDFAPENDEDLDFCKYIRSKGILPSVGHSDARYEELLPAVREGCTLVTHLYSCTSTITRQQGFRHLGIVETAYLLPELDVEIIADGKHLPPELINMIVKIKGREHVALVTDSLSATGLAITEGVMDGSPFIVEDGVCKLPDRSAFAGSIALPDQLLRTVTAECGISMVDGVYMLTATPARILGLPKGRLEAGLDGDVVVFDDSISIKALFSGGIQRI